MQTNNQKAFTILELVFVIIVIGILSAIALPRFASTADAAYLSKAKSTLATVRMAVTTERQKRILRGDTTTEITDLGDSTKAFNLMSADADSNQASVLRHPRVNCATGQRACWDRVDATHYNYRFPNAVSATDGVAKFKLEDNKLVCDNDASDCAKLE